MSSERQKRRRKAKKRRKGKRKRRTRKQLNKKDVKEKVRDKIMTREEGGFRRPAAGPLWGANPVGAAAVGSQRRLLRDLPGSCKPP